MINDLDAGIGRFGMTPRQVIDSMVFSTSAYLRINSNAIFLSIMRMETIAAQVIASIY
jgi:hypothetical protein